MSIELQAKSLDEARALAAGKLGVEPGRVQLTVLEESKGLFGKTSVKVRAEVAAEAPAKAAKPTRAPKAKAKAEPIEAPEPVAEPVAEKPTRAAKEKAEKPRAERPARGRKEAPKPEAAAKSDVEGAEGEAQATQQDADNFLGVLNELIDKTGLAIEAKCTGYSGKYVSIQFDGKDTGYLVGKHGEVLNSFQYLTNIIAAQQWGNGVRATLDGNDYRSRREEQLTTLATKIAEQVRKRGEEAVLDALPAFERRIVHKALSEIEGVSTYSEGEEPNRRVVIAPAE